MLTRIDIDDSAKTLFRRTRRQTVDIEMFGMHRITETDVKLVHCTILYFENMR